MKMILGAAILIECNSEEKKIISDLLSSKSLLYLKTLNQKKGRYKKINGAFKRAKPKIPYFIPQNKGKGIWNVFVPTGSFPIIKRRFPQISIIDKRVFPNEDIGFLPEVKKNITLRRFQVEALAVSKIRHNGIFEVPTGGGKTILGLSLIDEAKTKTLVVCDSTEIFNQWVSSINNMFGFMPGIIKGAKTDFAPPIVIAMSQTLINRPELKKQSKTFGMLIVDECQQIGPGCFYNPQAPMYNGMGTITQWFACKKKYGMTDSVARSDGQSIGVKYALGPIIYSAEYDDLEQENCIVKPTLIVRETKFTTNLNPTDDYGKVVWELIKDEDRNKLIIKDLLNEEDRFCLILANSRKYVRMLAGMLIESNPDLNSKIVVLTASTPRKKREQALDDMRNKKFNYLFCTSLADKGMDIPVLDRLFMVFPGRFEGKKKQQLGRVVRFQDQKQATVYEYVDKLVPIMLNQFRNRLEKVYKPRCTVDFTDPLVEELCDKKSRSRNVSQDMFAMNFTL